MSNITLAHGSGGEEFGKFVENVRSKLKFTGNWQNTMDDGATILFDLFIHGSQNFSNPALRQLEAENSQHLVFTTDSFVVKPLFFAGGDIGKISFCGTVNDLAMMGARPLGLSLALIIEEGLDCQIIDKILESIDKMSKNEKIPIVTGDTKVMGRGQIDKLAIITSGVGVAENIIRDGGMNIGDEIIVSGSIGDHGATLLAARFNYETKLKSDCKPLAKEIQEIKNLITSCKDITRGGISAIFNEMSKKAGMKFVVDEKKIPFRKEVLSICKILGISQYALPCEGRFVCTAPQDKAHIVVSALKKFNSRAAIIGRVVSGNNVILETEIGERILESPRGELIPRIC